MNERVTDSVICWMTVKQNLSYWWKIHWFTELLNDRGLNLSYDQKIHWFTHLLNDTGTNLSHNEWKDSLIQWLTELNGIGVNLNHHWKIHESLTDLSRRKGLNLCHQQKIQWLKPWPAEWQRSDSWWFTELLDDRGVNLSHQLKESVNCWMTSDWFIVMTKWFIDSLPCWMTQERISAITKRFSESVTDLRNGREEHVGHDRKIHWCTDLLNK